MQICKDILIVTYSPLIYNHLFVLPYYKENFMIQKQVGLRIRQIRK